MTSEPRDKVDLEDLVKQYNEMREYVNDCYDNYYRLSERSKKHYNESRRMHRRGLHSRADGESYESDRLHRISMRYKNHGDEIHLEAQKIMNYVAWMNHWCTK